MVAGGFYSRHNPPAMRVRFEGIGKRFGAHAALRDIDLEVHAGECLVLLGPSGCGKTTLLRLLAGLETPDAGKLWIGDRVVNDLPPAERVVAMVFQNYALYPHFTVFENIAFPLRARHVAEAEIGPRVRQAAARLELEALLERRPAELSGGQQQRVALARAIVRSPVVYLMDEPLSNLDAQLRIQTRAELKRLQQELGTTTLYVTHDQGEAMTMGARVAVLRAGVLEQVGRPLDLYREPANKFVATFVGSPAINVWPTERDGIEMGVRAEDIRISPAAVPGWTEARVLVVEPLGNETIVTLATDDRKIVARAGADLDLPPGAPAWFSLAPERALFFEAATGLRVQAVGGPPEAPHDLDSREARE
jgi:multiple sugar transport system ATP-binding protein